MTIIDLGSGPPVVVIPGAQGRWEWMRPGIDALAESCRVITFSLADEPGTGVAFDERSGFECYVEQVRLALDEACVQRAAICGVSYGGLIALAFAARHPERTRSLVLVSAISPSWTPDARQRFYLRAPRLFSPLFAVASPIRMSREIAAAIPARRERLRAWMRHGWNVLTHMLSPARMARRVALLGRVDLRDAATHVRVPTLLVTGEPELDSVVPVRVTDEYRRLIPHTRGVVVERTGHIGMITRPRAWAGALAPFVREVTAGDVPNGSRSAEAPRHLHDGTDGSRRRVG